MSQEAAMSGERKGCIKPDPRQRSVLEHGIALREFSDSTFGAAQREAYMRQHGIVFADGDLFWAKDLEHSAADSKRETSDADAARIVRGVVGEGVGQQLRAPGKVFTREEVLTALRVFRTQWFDRGTDLDKGAKIAIQDIIWLFERME